LHLFAIIVPRYDSNPSTSDDSDEEGEGGGGGSGDEKKKKKKEKKPRTAKTVVGTMNCNFNAY
jgi:structure-specific recognition protein 1